MVLREDNAVTINKSDIEQYLFEVKEAVQNNRYRIDRNRKRIDNINLFIDYVIDEDKAKEIILDLNVMDFSGILQNKHVRFGHEQLYVFGKEVKLLERYGANEKTVSLYIIKFMQRDEFASGAHFSFDFALDNQLFLC